MVNAVEIPVETGRHFWLRWVAANALGLGAGTALFGVLDDTVGELGDTGDAIAHLGGLPLCGGSGCRVRDSRCPGRKPVQNRDRAAGVCVAIVDRAGFARPSRVHKYGSRCRIGRFTSTPPPSLKR